MDGTNVSIVVGSPRTFDMRLPNQPISDLRSPQISLEAKRQRVSI